MKDPFHWEELEGVALALEDRHEIATGIVCDVAGYTPSPEAMPCPACGTVQFVGDRHSARCACETATGRDHA